MILLKMLHYLAMTVGVGFGLAGLVMMRVVAARGPEAMATLMPVRIRLGQISGLALLVLWITGLWMWLSLHGGALGGWFMLKLLLVVGLTAVSVMINLAVIRAGRGGPAPDPARMKRLAQIASTLAMAIVVVAVLAFA